MTSTPARSNPAASPPGARFPAGTFTPAPQANRALPMLAAQARLELLLLLRNGEQLLLTLLIPITLLIGFTILPVGTVSEPRAAAIIPGILALAIMSTAFTGQAIAVGFDRRYGALKRLGATPLPTWAIIGGKSAAVIIVVALQMVVLGAIALALGWRPAPLDLLASIPAVAVGTVAFAALGLFLGGWLRAEIVLALANLLWFVLAGIGSIVLASSITPGTAPASSAATIAELTPSGALVAGLQEGLAGQAGPLPLLVLAAWAVLFTVGAARTFRFT
ncbi:ABC transporter permease [Hoyosella sp. G463]|uniref:ABC transporter permease n=1 Tax=Lolliginicoccus lacisalsi TaxID=2742202 RepID=A0A927JAC4_9ACTN|nr:ABC transporter permease [Lolliginicoccus lacisalsi]MBD8505245.1 ABC transporter permease [Lolliginicoccus lacisalsi]